MATGCCAQLDFVVTALTIGCTGGCLRKALLGKKEREFSKRFFALTALGVGCTLLSLRFKRVGLAASSSYILLVFIHEVATRIQIKLSQRETE